MTEQQNTRPSASREIAVKPLKWVKDPKNVSFVDAEYVDTFGLYCIAERVLFIGHTETGIPFDTVKEAKAAAQADYERRILSALDTTPGNTDDELRKVQGGWREDVDTDFIYPPIPDRSHDWYARFKWHDGDTDLRGHGKTELDAVFDLFRNALDFDDGDGSEQEAVLDAAWLGIGGSNITEHPTEQPSVRAGAVDALAAYQQADQDGIMVLVSRQAIEECLPALRSLAQEGE